MHVPEIWWMDAVMVNQNMGYLRPWNILFI